jgi:ubiquinone/menaquinone biosynthesis C-methylase UbiE
MGVIERLAAGDRVTRADDQETFEKNRRSWDAISARYQSGTRIAADDVHYGPLAPGERELGLLGDVRGKRILEIGCGGGQNAIALARWGARCTGLDPSAEQLAHARRLALEHGVEVEFVTGAAQDLGRFSDGSYDIALSSYTFDYVGDLGRAYGEAWRVLKRGGLFVFCLSHPWFQAVGWHLAGDPEAPEIGDYASWPTTEEWDWIFEEGSPVRFRGHLRTVEGILNDLIESGFVVDRMVEQNIEDVAATSPDERARFPYVSDLDPQSAEYGVMRKLPRTLIVCARKGETRSR